MLFSLENCKAIHKGYNNTQAEYVMNDVNWNVSRMKDLGVVVNDDLKSEKQCSEES